MARSLLQLPSELLTQILATLPVKALLAFGKSSRYTRRLVISNFHALTVAFHSSRCSDVSHRQATTSNKKRALPIVLANERPDPDSILIRLDPTYDFAILLNLHCALVENLLLRYSALRRLDMTLWTLTVPMAKAIAHLSALRELSIRIDKGVSIPNSYKMIEGLEQPKAWDALVQNAVWAPTMRSLRLENTRIDAVHLIELLQFNSRLRELCLSSCAFVDGLLLEFMGSAWCGRTGLRTLKLEECDDVLDGNALEAIGKLSGLQVSNSIHASIQFLTCHFSVWICVIAVESIAKRWQ
jgi:hypothetical protein